MKTEKIELRISPGAKAVIQGMAAECNCSISTMIKQTIFAYVMTNYPLDQAQVMIKELNM